MCVGVESGIDRTTHFLCVRPNVKCALERFLFVCAQFGLNLCCVCFQCVDEIATQDRMSRTVDTLGHTRKNALTWPTWLRLRLVYEFVYFVSIVCFPPFVRFPSNAFCRRCKRILEEVDGALTHMDKISTQASSSSSSAHRHPIGGGVCVYACFFAVYMCACSCVSACFLSLFATCDSRVYATKCACETSHPSVHPFCRGRRDGWEYLDRDSGIPQNTHCWLASINSCSYR